MGLTGDVVVEHAGTFAREAPARARDLFVLHAAGDADFVRGYLLPALDLPPERVLLIDALPLGGMVVSEIERGVSSSRVTVAVLSPAYLADHWAVFGELLASHAIAQDVHVIPLRLCDCQVPLHLDARVALDFTDPARWDAETARLRELLHTAAPAEPQIPCPYPGMRAFGERDASRFFGRDAEIAGLIRRLDRDEREIYVIGPSGSGKSSLVQAGLLPVLDAGSSRLGRSFVARTMRPGESPADRLAKLLDGDLATPGAAVEAFVARHPPAERVLVVVDQLEELFTFAGADERQRFVAALRALHAERRCYLLLALRADFYGALMDSALWSDAASTARVDVAPLRGAALAQAIQAPALRLGVHIEARLCDRLVVDAAEEPGALPLVQETLRLLWDRRCQRLLGLAAYDALGNGRRALEVAIAERADTAMVALTAAQRTIARRMLLRLVGFGEGRADIRRQQGVGALRSAADDAAEFAHVLRHLVEHRLVTVDAGDAGHGALADLSHEALITAWPALRTWIDGRRADERQRRRLEAKLAEWIERGRGTARLLDPVELAEAAQWMQSDAARELGYGTELAAFVTASRRQLARVEHQRRQRAVRVFAALAAFCIVAAMLAVVAWRQHEARRAANAAQHLLAMTHLEQGRLLLIDGHPVQALPYLVAARAEGMDSPALRVLFAQAASHVPAVTLVGHSAGVLAAAFSADGTRVVTASEDRTARVWDVATGELITAPLLHQGKVIAAAFSTDGTRVVTASEDRTTRVWDAMTGKLLAGPLQHRGLILSATFNSDGTRVVTASEDRTAQVWDGTTGKPVAAPLVHLATVTAAAFSADGRHVVTASEDWTARVWDATTGRPVTPPLAHRDRVTGASFSADGMRVLTTSWDKTTQVWDVTTGKLVTAPLAHRNRITAAAFSTDGTRVVTVSDGQTARVWEVAMGRLVTAPFEHQGPITAASFSADAARVVTASLDRTARVWNVTAGGVTAVSLEHQASVVTAAFSADGRRIVTASWDNTARVWDPSTGKPVTTPLEHHGYVADVALSADGTRVVTASGDRTARVWDVATGEPVTPLLEHHGRVSSAAFSADGTRVVTASDDSRARVWDVATGTLVVALVGHQDIVTAAAFNAEGTRVVTASQDHTAQVWDVTTGRPVTAPLRHAGTVWSAAFSPDDTQVITASQDSTAQVWDAATGEATTAPLRHQGYVRAARFSPDGTRVITASDDKTARVWDATTGEPLLAPLEHEDAVTSAVFSADGTMVVTASKDGTARVWDATTGQPLMAPLLHQLGVTAAAFSPDGTMVVTASKDRTARAWSLPIDMGALADWQRLARCSPFALSNITLIANPSPLTACPVSTGKKALR